MSPEDFAEWLAHKAARDASRAELAILTARQKALVRLIAQGFDRGESARRLGVSLRVTEVEVAAIKDVTGLTQNELIVQATRAGWV
jgi:DNA-binding CsgD family transcriptional regulator